jgi:hypothetical protein
MEYFMSNGFKSRKFYVGLTLGFLCVTGSYNAFVINSESIISGNDIRFAKRLDEVYGVVVSKREVANSMAWQKLSVRQAAIYKNTGALSVPSFQALGASDEAQQSEGYTQAAVQEELSLNLTGVINPKKWQQGLNNSQFSGNLSTNQGVIESLSVSLPNGEGVSVSFSEMSGNVFEYDFNGELYSGMMYQENQNSYVVTLTNGPLEGTRLTFTGEISTDSQSGQPNESENVVADNNNTEAISGPEQGNSQAEAAQIENLEAQDIYAQEQGQLDQAPEQAQGFNFESTQAAI